MNAYQIVILDLAGRIRTGMTALFANADGIMHQLWFDSNGTIPAANPFSVVGVISIYAKSSSMRLVLTDSTTGETMAQDVTPLTRQIVFTPESGGSLRGSDMAHYDDDGEYHGVTPVLPAMTTHILAEPVVVQAGSLAVGDVLRVRGMLRLSYQLGGTWAKWNLQVLLGESILWSYRTQLGAFSELPFGIEFDSTSVVLRCGVNGCIASALRTRVLMNDSHYWPAEYWKKYEHGVLACESTVDLTRQNNWFLGWYNTESYGYSFFDIHIKTLSFVHLRN